MYLKSSQTHGDDTVDNLHYCQYKHEVVQLVNTALWYQRSLPLPRHSKINPVNKNYIYYVRSLHLKNRKHVYLHTLELQWSEESNPPASCLRWLGTMKIEEFPELVHKCSKVLVVLVESVALLQGSMELATLFGIQILEIGLCKMANRSDKNPSNIKTAPTLYNLL